MVCSQQREVPQPVAAWMVAEQAAEYHHLPGVLALPSEVVVLRLQRQPIQPGEAYPVSPGMYHQAEPAPSNYHRTRLDYPPDFAPLAPLDEL